MAEQTLLQMTQTILSAMDSDEVNSISDTVESLQVANIIQRKYYDILTRGALPETKQLFQLTPSNNTALPVQMTVPAGVSEIEWIKYFDSNPGDNEQVDQFGSFSHDLNTDITPTNSWTTTSTSSVTIGVGTHTFIVASAVLPVQIGQGVIAFSGPNSMFGTVVSYVGTTLVMNAVSIIGSGTFSVWTLSNSAAGAPAGYKYVTVIPIDQFLEYVNRFNISDADTFSYTFTEGGNNFVLYYKNDIQPKYCCVLQNTFVLFDAYNVNFDTTLQASKTMVYGQLVPPFSLTDGFIPSALDDNQFPLLVNEAMAWAFYELKQMPHVKAEQEIKRQWSAVQKNKAKVIQPSYFDALADFGRVPRTGGYSSGGYGAYKWMRQSQP